MSNYEDQSLFLCFNIYNVFPVLQLQAFQIECARMRRGSQHRMAGRAALVVRRGRGRVCGGHGEILKGLKHSAF